MMRIRVFAETTKQHQVKLIMFPLKDTVIYIRDLKNTLERILGGNCEIEQMYLGVEGEDEKYLILDEFKCLDVLRDMEKVFVRYKEKDDMIITTTPPLSTPLSPSENPSSEDSVVSSSSDSDSDSNSESESSSVCSSEDEGPEEMMILKSNEPPKNNDILTNVSLFMSHSDHIADSCTTVNDFIYPRKYPKVLSTKCHLYEYHLNELVPVAEENDQAITKLSNKKKQTNKRENTYQKKQKTNLIDFSRLPEYSKSIPVVGDVIAFKELVLDNNLFIPKLSDYQCARINKVSPIINGDFQLSLEMNYDLQGIQQEFLEDQTFRPVSSKPLPSEIYRLMYEEEQEQCHKDLKWSQLLSVRLFQ